MCARYKIRNWLIIGFTFALRLVAQDTLMYHELMNPEISEACHNEGRSSLKLFFENEIGIDLRTDITYNDFIIHYRMKGWRVKEYDQYGALEWATTHFHAALGRGRPNIAKGLILGNTMMRFTPALSSQAGIRAAKLRSTASDYYKPLINAGMNFCFPGHNVNYVLNAFRYNDHYGAIAEFGHEKLNSGIAVYPGNRTITEIWSSYGNKKFKACLDLSLAGLTYNHMYSDLFYRQGRLDLFAAIVHLENDFIAIKADSKWGSGLLPGSRGYAGGIGFTGSPCKMNAIAFLIDGKEQQEQRVMIDFRYTKTPFEFRLLYTDKLIETVKSAETFPFALTLSKQLARICKAVIKVRLTRNLDLSCQCQADLTTPDAYAAYLRISYQTEEKNLRLQISHAGAGDADLYYVRPLSPSYYGIRKAAKEPGYFIDLVCSRKIGNYELYILLRSEGIQTGIICK